MRRCHECGFPLGSKDVFCPRCGAKQRRERAIPVIIALTGNITPRTVLTRAALNHG